MKRPSPGPKKVIQKRVRSAHQRLVINALRTAPNPKTTPKKNAPNIKRSYIIVKNHLRRIVQNKAVAQRISVNHQNQKRYQKKVLTCKLIHLLHYIALAIQGTLSEYF